MFFKIKKIYATKFKSWCGHGRTDRTGSAGPAYVRLTGANCACCRPATSHSFAVSLTIFDTFSRSHDKGPKSHDFY